MPSTTEQRFLERLKEQQRDYATATLQHPPDKSEFGYGEASGTYHGLLIAEQLFKEVIGEEDDEP